MIANSNGAIGPIDDYSCMAVKLIGNGLDTTRLWCRFCLYL